MSKPDIEPWRVTFRRSMSPTEEIIEDARNGRMFILVDDEDRENEGDLVIPAQMATPEAINFMAKHGRGLICLALTPRARRAARPAADGAAQRHAAPDRLHRLDRGARRRHHRHLRRRPRAHHRRSPSTRRKGRTTSSRPGHVFPLMARDGGVLVRAGHTEAAVDLARLAGLDPAGVICEIMNDDGTMARRADLVTFAQRHGLKIGTIADLIAYRRRHDRIVERVLETDSRQPLWRRISACWSMSTRVAYAEHIALVKGDVAGAEPVLVRMHALNVLDDVLGDRRAAGGGELHAAMRMIAEAGRGVVVLIREPRPTACPIACAPRRGDGGRAGRRSCATMASARRSCSISACAR